MLIEARYPPHPFAQHKICALTCSVRVRSAGHASLNHNLDKKCPNGRCNFACLKKYRIVNLAREIETGPLCDARIRCDTAAGVVLLVGGGVAQTQSLARLPATDHVIPR